MARPRKTGLDYFPFDVDFYDDFKIMDLLGKYGPLGTTIYEIVISRVYKNGYYLEVPLDMLAAQIVRIIGNRWIKDKNLVLQVIQYCADIGLFDNALLTQSVITSVGIQRRYSEVTVRNKVDKSKYWLLEKNNCQAALENAPQNNVSATETQVNVADTNVNVTSIPQKKSKVNKSKLNESKVEDTSTTDNNLNSDYQSVITLFNAICISLNAVTLDDTKIRKILMIQQQHNNFDFESFFERVEKSDFLTGRNGRWNIGGTKAYFDWIMKPDNVSKILSGTYDNKEVNNNAGDRKYSAEELKILDSLGDYW